MKLNYKKNLKFVTLLISALLIATVSATIYDYMYLNADIGVEGMYLAWVSGGDGTNAGTSINGVTATLTSLKGPPNGMRIYADPVRLNNTGASQITFNLAIDNITGDTSEMDSIYVKIYSLNTSLWIQNMTIWASGTQGSGANNLPIPARHLWRFQWEIKWKSTATTSHSVTVNLKLEVPVA